MSAVDATALSFVSASGTCKRRLREKSKLVSVTFGCTRTPLKVSWCTTRVVEALTLVFYLRVERLSVDFEKKLNLTVRACTSERSDAGLIMVSTWSAVSGTAVALFQRTSSP